MPTISPLTCSNLLPLYRAWGDEIQAAKKLLDVFVKDGTQEAREEVEELFQAVEQNRGSFLESLDEPAVFRFNNLIEYQCTKLEQLGLETIQQILGRAISLDLRSDGFKITKLDFSYLSSSAETIDVAVSFVSLFDSLQTFYCYGTNLSSLLDLPKSLTTLNCCNNSKLSSLPNPLPDSLIWINIKNTPAASNPETIAQLEEFKRKHPDARIITHPDDLDY